MNIPAADVFFGIFGMKRVSQDDCKSRCVTEKRESVTQDHIANRNTMIEEAD